MYLLDTNVISELRRAEWADVSVRRWSEKQDFNHFFLSAVTILEMEFGTLRMTRRDPLQGQLFRAWVTKTLIDFEGRILPVDVNVALRCAALHVPDPKPDRDAYIAATGLVHDMTVVTRNTRDFEATGCRLVDPWSF